MQERDDRNAQRRAGAVNNEYKGERRQKSKKHQQRPDEESK